MSINNFVPEIWSAKILKDLKKKQVLVKNCTDEYTGEIKGVGSVVRINQALPPTSGKYIPNQTEIIPKQLDSRQLELRITEAEWFAFFIDDVDDKKSMGKLFAETLVLANDNNKNKSERFVADIVKDNAVLKMSKTGINSGNIISTLLSAKTTLLENDVPAESIFLEVTPRIWEKMLLANIVYTDTGKTLNSGKFIEQLGMYVYVSNNLTTSGTPETSQNECIMRTKRAVAFAQSINKTEKFRPEKAFADAIKGLYVYGGKLLRPKEVVYLDLETTPETLI